jgi:hypothetical protein
MLAGCGMAIRVSHLAKEGKAECLPGVPFYTKAVACKQETVWFEQTYKLTLVAAAGSGDVFNVSKEIPRKVYVSDEYQKLINLVHKSDANQEFNKILDAFFKLPSYAPPSPGFLPSLTELVLASNQSEPFTFIDYADPHYYNAKIPLAGSVNAEVNLSPELTLSKASANIQEQTLKTFLDLLPIKEVLSGVAKAATAKAIQIVSVRLTIEPQVYNYTLSNLGAKVKILPCGDPGEPLKDPSKGTFSRKLMPADESKKKEDEGKKIKFSGSVDLPK